MAKREKPRSGSFVHVGDRLVNTKDLTQAQRRELATQNVLAFMNTFYIGRAVFSRAESGEEGSITRVCK